MIEVVLKARYSWMEEAIQQCVDGQLTFSDLCKLFADKGYKTTSLYEMVRAAEQSKK